MRPQDDLAIANATSGNGSEIGAVEVIPVVSGKITLAVNPTSNPSGAAVELVEAILAANDHPNQTTIGLKCGVYLLTALNNTLYGPTGLPFITSEVRVEGNGAIIERRSGDSVPAFRLFTVAGAGDLDPVTNAPLTKGNLTLNNVWLRGGLARGGKGGNGATSGGGGGLGAGGAIYNRGTLNILSSTLSANTAQGGAGGSTGDSGWGGGGGGMGGFGGGGALYITNATFSGNAAFGGAAGTGGSGVTGGKGLGGAVFARNGVVSINHTTLNANTVKNGDSTAGAGGALYLLGDGATVYIDGAGTQQRPGNSDYLTHVGYRVTNSILANTAGGATDAFVNTVNGGGATQERPDDDVNNLVEVNGTGANALPKVLVTDDPMLDPELKVIVDCGPGQCHSPVHRLFAGSPAIDKTHFDERVEDDQTGRPRRPFDAFDIGAFEYCGPPISADNLAAAVADPLGCAGPNSLIVGSGAATNPNGFPLTPVTLSIALPAQLTVIPGSVTCTFTPSGGATTFCGLVGNQPTWTGTLDPMQTVTVSYQARVAAGTPMGTTLTTTTSVNAPGATASTQSPPFVLNCPLANLKNPPAAAAVTDQKPGSVLVFPYYTSAADGNFAKSDTLLTITNVADGPSVGANGAPNYAYLHLFFLNGANCSPADTFICLTPNGSLQIRASEYDPLTTGYLIAVAVDEQGRPVQNNSFIGSAFVRDDVGGIIDSYGAEAFQKLSPGALALDADGGATLYLDGADYDPAPIQLAATLQDPVIARQSLVIASLRGDLGTKLDATAQSGVGGVWRDDEAPASFTNGLGSGCLIERAVTNQNFRLVPGTLTSFLQNRTGYLKVNLTSPAVGLLLTRQGAPGQPQGRFAGIRSLHKTAVTASALRLPVFTPVCQ